jgi:hypothetical protein
MRAPRRRVILAGLSAVGLAGLSDRLFAPQFAFAPDPERAAGPRAIPERHGGPIRDTLMDRAYFDKLIAFTEETDAKNRRFVASTPFDDPQYRAQFIFTIFRSRYELMLLKYSRGDALEEIKGLLPGVVDDREWASREEVKVFSRAGA